MRHVAEFYFVLGVLILIFNLCCYSRHQSEPTIVAEPKEFTALPTNETWCSVACGDYHSVALSKNGHVYTWGKNQYGQLGHGTKGVEIGPTSTQYFVPKRVECLVGHHCVVQVSCGENHTAALTKEGVLLTWYV